MKPKDAPNLKKRLRMRVRRVIGGNDEFRLGAVDVRAAVGDYAV